MQQPVQPVSAGVQADKVAVASLRNEVEADRAEVASKRTLVLGYRDDTLAARDETKTTAATFTPASLNHDDRYYTGAEVDSLVISLAARVAALEAKLVNVTVSGAKTIFCSEIEVVDLGRGK